MQVPWILHITGRRDFISILKEQFDLLKRLTNSDFAFFYLKFELSGEYWSKEPVIYFEIANVRVIGGFELSSDFIKRVLRKVQGECKNFELLEVQFIGGLSYQDSTVFVEPLTQQLIGMLKI